MTRRLKAALRIMTLTMAILVLALTQRQVFSPTIDAHPDNRRALLEELDVERGSIFSADGAVLAQSLPTDTGHKRTYPKGAAFAPVTGYYSPILGRAGVEATWSEWLAARDHFNSVDDLLRSLVDNRRRGFDITLTIDPATQLKAWSRLGDRRGAIIALDPKTGAVMALVSKPIFDPNKIDSDWSRISSQEGLLVNRAIDSQYSPGSIFKIVTTAAALDNGVATAEKVYDGPAVLPVYGGRVTNFADQDAGRMPLEKAFAKSTNTIFAQVGLELGATRLIKAARDFGFGAKLPFDLSTTKSTMAGASMDKVMLAWTAVGQGDTLATPLQMALIGAGIAEDGKIFEPYMVEFVRDYQGMTRYQHKPHLFARATAPETAREIKNMMVETVHIGTGKNAASTAVTVAGKTGTAEVGGGQPPHAWFVGFAPAENPQVAVVVLVENGGLGGAVAAPIAKDVLLTALDQ